MTSHLTGRWTRRIASAGALACAIPAAGVAAQDVEHATGPTLEEIVVTARSREESLLDVPDTVTVFSEASIEQYGIDEYFDFIRVTPGLSFVEASQSPGIALLNIRGIGQQLNQEPPVAVVVDGIQVASAAAITQALVDVERIEVVKGPQGALYGRNAIGGAIIVTSKQPTAETSGHLQVDYGDDGYAAVEGALRGGLGSERILASVVGRWSDFDGDFTNAFTGLETNPLEDWLVRGRIVATLTERIEADFRYSRSETRNAGYNGVILPDGDAGFFDARPLSGHAGSGLREVDEVAAKFSLATSIGTLTWTSALVSSSDESGYDLDQVPVELVDLALQSAEVDALSEEIRLTSSSDRALRYTGGFYYLDTEIDRRTTVTLHPLVTGAPVPINLPTDTTQQNEAWAAFLQVNYDLTEALELTGALRYDEDDREQTDRLSGTVDSRTFDSLQPKLSVAYALGSDSLLYATYAEGFRSGGFNQPTPTFPLVYPAEETSSYEIGTKLSALDDRLRLSAAAFLSEQENQQVTLVDVQNSGAQGIVSIDETRFTGAEFELQAVITNELRLSMAAAHVDSEIRRFAAAPQFEGNSSPYAPEWTWNVALDWSKSLPDDWLLDFHVDYAGQSGMYYEYFGTIEQPAYGMTNVRIEVSRGRYNFEVFGENVFDKAYYTDAVSNFVTGGLGNFGIRGRRDQFGVRFRVDY